MAPFGASRAGLMSVTRDDIPDSAIYHYPFPDRSDDTLVEQLQGENGTAVGLTNTSGDWWEGFAEAGDGTDDYGDLTTLPLFSDPLVSDHTTDFWVAMTVKTTVDSGDLTGARHSASNDGHTSWFRFGVGVATDDGKPILLLRGADGDDVDEDIRVAADQTVNDGNKHRIVLNKIGNDGNDWEWYIDGSSVSTIIERNDGIDDFGDWTRDFYTHAYNDRGSDANHFDGTIDNIFFGEPGNTLSSQEVTDDYNAQPWT